MTTWNQTMQQPDQTNPELQTEPLNQERARRKRVLVVDDERIIADTLATIFRNAGYEAVPAYDGASALSQCASFPPDLVITDVVMPGMNGIEMAIQVKQRYPACKILMFSGQASTANLLEEARQRGYDFELLAKPVHPAELLARVTE
jgi:CheY-like chemotaxis protein